MPGRVVLQIADRWWAGDFDCEQQALRPSATRVQAHAGRMVGATGIWILGVGGAPVISVPHPLLGSLEARARRWTSAIVEDVDALAASIADLSVKRIVGPAFIGYGTARTLDLSLASKARGLKSPDHTAVDRLRAACPPEAWEHGGSDPKAVPTFGCVDDRGEVLALAGYRTWGGEIAHLSVVSHPDARGRGLANAAVARAARHALDAGLLPQYRTLAANAPSMGVAGRLGFERYGASVFVRLGNSTSR